MRRWAGPVLACLVAVGLVAGCSAEESRRPDGPVGPGPAPGTFEREWSLEAGSADIRMADGIPVALLEEGLQAYDPATGKPTWRYGQQGRLRVGFATTDGMVVLRTLDANNANSQLVGIDAGTGEIRWEADEDWSLPGTAVGGTVIVEPEDGDTRLGIDARTGDQRWEVSRDDVSGDGGCATGDQQGEPADGPVIPVYFLCDDGGDTKRLAALDVETGDVRWSTPVHTRDADQTAIALDGSVVLLSRGESHRPELRDAAGRRVFAGGPRTSCSCALLTSGPYVVLHYREGAADGDDRGMVAIIDSRNGKRQVVAEPDQLRSGGDGWTADGKGRVYRVGPQYGNDGELLLPAAVEVLDLATGTFRRSPLPIQGAPGGRLEHVDVLSAAGERIVAAFGTDDPSGQARIASFVRTGGGEPFELGGVPVDRWPEACRLLDGVARPEGQVLQDRLPVEVGRWKLPSVTCRLAKPGGGAADSVEVRVEWIAATERQADLLVDGDPSHVPGVAEVGEHPVYPGEVFRVGRAIVVVDDHTDDQSTVDVIVGNLRRFLER